MCVSTLKDHDLALHFLFLTVYPHQRLCCVFSLQVERFVLVPCKVLYHLYVLGGERSSTNQGDKLNQMKEKWRKDTGGRGLYGNKHQLIKIKTVGAGCFSSVNCPSWSRAMWRGSANLWCDGFRGVLQQTDSVWLFVKKKIWNVTSFNTLLRCQIRLVLNGCFTMRGCSSKLHTNTVFYPLNAPSHMGWQQECIAGNERPTVTTPLSLSFSLLTVQHCSASLHMPRQTGREPQQVWAHEKYYQPASQTLCTKAVFAHGTESLVLQKCKWTPCRRFWNLKNAPPDTSAVTWVEPVTLSWQGFLLSQGHSASHKLLCAEWTQLVPL